MSVATFEGVVENRQVRLAGDVRLLEKRKYTLSYRRQKQNQAEVRFRGNDLAHAHRLSGCRRRFRPAYQQGSVVDGRLHSRRYGEDYQGACLKKTLYTTW